MTRQPHSTDGFVPRRSATPQAGSLRRSAALPPVQPVAVRRTIGKAEHPLTGADAARPAALKGSVSRSEIDESLKGIDSPDKRPKKRKGKLSSKQIKRIIKWVIILILVIGLGVAAYVGFKALMASKNIFKGNVFDIVQSKPLQADANGRSNIIVFGTAEDDEGGTHEGGNLTDSLMVVSLDQKKKDVFMLSIPRDMWVQYAETCTVGNQGKVNATYFCASDDGADEEAGANALKDKMGDITGLEMHYYVHLNFTAVVELVNAVGGVDVTIESEDPRGILDRNFDWKCGYRCYFVNYKNGQQVHLDGEHALALARARNASGGYGLPNGNFDREKNQQKIIKALQQKAVSAGTLTNIGKVTGIIDALGRNLRTNFEVSEIRTLMDVGQAMKPENMHSLSLVTEGESLVTTGSYSGQSIVRPIAGILDYSAIHQYVRQNVSSDPVSREKATVAVLNGSGMAGAAQTEATKLEEQNFTIGEIGNAPEGDYGKVTIYQIDASKTGTAAKLKKIYGAKLLATAPPVPVAEGTAFIVIVGTIAESPSSNE